MAAVWFYLDGEERRGPIAVDELVRALLTHPRPWDVPVWREGMSDWQYAGSVPEVRENLPPRPPVQSGNESGSKPFEDAEEIAKYYRFLVLLVGFQLLLGFFQLPGRMSPSSGFGALALVVSLGLLGLLAAISFTAYQLTRLLGEGLPILWAIAMFIPCINILGLLLISNKAQIWCRRYGIKVGFFGPTKESIEELRRRGIASRFD